MLDTSKAIKIEIAPDLVSAFYMLSEQKISHEKWSGRNTRTKIDNFHLCYLSEYGLKEVLGQYNIKYAYRGLVVGPVEIVGKEDFLVWISGEQKSLGLRSRNAEQFFKYEELPYPDDRLRLEPEKISDYIIASSVELGQISKSAEVLFWGCLEKEQFLEAYSHARVKYSYANQEQFRLVPVHCFRPETLENLLGRLDRH